MDFEKEINRRVQEVKNDENWCVKFINWNVAQMNARDEGELIGERRGEYNAKLETARNFLRMGLTVEQVSAGSGLPIAEIAAL